MTYRRATREECSLLAEMNRQLIEDERHRNQSTVPELKERMERWLAGEYEALIFEEDVVIGYALYRPEPDQVYLRQLFICRPFRRKGFGRKAVSILRTNVWPQGVRLTVDVLVTNSSALSFWRSVGYRDYCLTLEILPDQPR